MELEFDKEIDAILHRARGSGASAVTADPHIDADAIAAFVENAVPAATRLFYMKHFADCDRCRKLLSQSILMNETAASAAVGAAEVVERPIAMPWYQRLFLTPNLAVAMGVLVLVFSGVLGYLVLQDRSAESNASVAKVTDQETSKSVPSAVEPLLQANTNAAAANAASAQPEPASNASSNATTPPSSAGRSVAGPATEADDKIIDGLVAEPLAEKEKAAVATGTDTVAGRAATAAPPPPLPADKPKPGVFAGDVAEERKDEDAKLANKKMSEDSRRDLPAAPAKSGPTRAVGPVQGQTNQMNSNVFDMPVTRIVGGKTFENRNGAWYDRAYRNQATTNVRRGTDQYKKLDSGLRSIADNLGGTVVVVWKDKAYRIN